MSRLLISFCNTFPQGFPLAAYDFDSNDLEWIPAPELDLPIGGASGLCRSGEYYYVLLQHRGSPWPNTLAAYTADFKLRTAIRLERVSDGHSLIWRDNGLLAVSTGTNELVRITLDEAMATAQVESVWALGSQREDCHHLNSLAQLEGRLYGSMLGPTDSKDSHFERQDGSIADIASGKPVWTQLLHPHSLLACDDKLYCLESGRGRLWRFQGKECILTGEPIKDLPGYLRGLAIDGQFLYIGSSALRIRSKSTGELRAPSLETNIEARCRIYRLDLSTGQIACRELTPFAREIYDLILLPSDAPVPHPGSSEESIIRRQLAYDLEHQRALSDLSRAIEKYEALASQSAG